MMRKVILTVGIALVAFAISASSASAIPIGTTGGADTWLASIDQSVLGNSGEGTEEAWIETVIGSIDYDQLSSSGGEDGAWEAVTGGASGTDLWAFDFSAFGVTDPTHFLVKLGGGVVADSHHLYQNDASTNYGVVDLNYYELEPGKQISIATLSHTGAVGGGTTTVPEPGSLVMLAIGLGLVPFARRRV